MLHENSVNWQPIREMPLIARMIDGALDDTREHLKTLAEARVRPHVLDDATIDRVEKVHAEQMQFVDIYGQQISRWRTEKPSANQTRELDRMEANNRQLHAATADVLALASEPRHTDVAGQSAPSQLHLLPHRTCVGGEALGPGKYPFALRRETLEARAAPNQHDPQFVLELLDRRGQRGLGNPARICRLAEALLPRDRDEVAELVDHAGLEAAACCCRKRRAGDGCKGGYALRVSVAARTRF